MSRTVPFGSESSRLSRSHPLSFPSSQELRRPLGLVSANLSSHPPPLAHRSSSCSSWFLCQDVSRRLCQDRRFHCLRRPDVQRGESGRQRRNERLEFYDRPGVQRAIVGEVPATGVRRTSRHSHNTNYYLAFSSSIRNATTRLSKALSVRAFQWNVRLIASARVSLNCTLVNAQLEEEVSKSSLFHLVVLFTCAILQNAKSRFTFVYTLSCTS